MLRSCFTCLALAVVAATASAQEHELVFAVTEGVTYQATPKEIREAKEKALDSGQPDPGISAKRSA